ncbi:MAG: glycosyltransferase [Saprospiraceae bacterium]|nr:glycosyltransferase [Saprospiraceae bacterium]
MRTRVLLISYYWPPSGGGGVQRWLKMSRYLCDLNIDLTVYTPENGEFPGYDPSLVSQVDPRIKIVKRPIWEPYRLFKWLTGKKKDQNVYNALISAGKKPSLLQKLSVFIRGNFFIPDARCFWIRPSITFLTEYLRENPTDIIISTGPPHSMHLIALGIRKKFSGIRWIADFRDPWTMIDFYDDLMLTSWADSRHHRLEASVLAGADAIVTISPSCAVDLAGIAKREIITINNGYDPEDFVQQPGPLDDMFTISHVGSMNKDRNPEVLWNCLGKLSKELPGLAQKLRIHLIGVVDGEIITSILKNGLEKNLQLTGQCPHTDALRVMRTSQLLLLPINNIPQQKGVMPGKMYEYLGSNRPILAYGLTDSDAAALIVSTQSGRLFKYTDMAGTEKYLREAFEAYTRGELKVNSSGFSQYSRKFLATKYSELIHQLARV